MRWGNELSVTVHSPEAEDRLVTEVWRELLSGASDPRGRGCSGWGHGPLLQGCPVTYPACSAADGWNHLQTLDASIPHRTL